MFSKFLSTRSLLKAILMFCDATGALLLLIHQCMTGLFPLLSLSPFKNFYSVYLKQAIYLFIYLFSGFSAVNGKKKDRIHVSCSVRHHLLFLV